MRKTPGGFNLMDFIPKTPSNLSAQSYSFCYSDRLLYTEETSNQVINGTNKNRMQCYERSGQDCEF